MKRYLPLFILFICGLSIVSCIPNRKGKAVCQCKFNGAPDGTYEFGSETITEVQVKCANIQYYNPQDTCTAFLDN
jgi:hypothetical protein